MRLVKHRITFQSGNLSAILRSIAPIVFSRVSSKDVPKLTALGTFVKVIK
jgi:hypothetical protein